MNDVHEETRQQTVRQTHRQLTSWFEVPGSLLAIVYALLIASNTGLELIAFVLLFFSASLFGVWAVLDRRWAFLALQLFYATSAIIGLLRWS